MSIELNAEPTLFHPCFAYTFYHITTLWPSAVIATILKIACSCLGLSTEGRVSLEKASKKPMVRHSIYMWMPQEGGSPSSLHIPMEMTGRRWWSEARLEFFLLPLSLLVSWIQCTCELNIIFSPSFNFTKNSSAWRVAIPVTFASRPVWWSTQPYSCRKIINHSWQNTFDQGD